MTNEPDLLQMIAPLRSSPHPTDTLLEHIADAVALLDATWRFTYLNRSARRLLGRSSDELVGRELTAIYSRRIAQPFFEAYERALASGAPAQFEMFYEPTERWFEYRVMPAYGGIAVLFQEVTSHKALEAQLSSHEERIAALAALSAELAEVGLDYAAVLELAARRCAALLGDGCFVGLVSDDGRQFTPAVAAYCRTPDWLAAQALVATTPLPLDETLANMLALTGEAVLVAQLEGGAASMVPTPYRPLVERGLAQSLIVVPLRSHGRILGAVAVGRAEPASYGAVELQLAQGLADRAALAIESARLYKLAQEAAAVREQFLSIAAHELRTPLTTLMGYVFLLQRKLAADAAPDVAAAILSQMEQQGQRLDRLVNALLDVTRLGGDVFQLVRENFDVGALVGQVVAEVSPQLGRHTVHLQAAPEPVIVNGDADRLLQVVQNVLQNAVKYYPAGGPILVTVRSRDGQAQIAVRDQGIGIPPEAQGRLFEQFYRASNVDPRHISGLGVGLYVAHEIVTRHGGSIAVDSVVGRGSTFTICLPLAEPS